MPDFNPVVLKRMLTLRQHPMFTDVDFGELAVLADNLVEVSYPEGAIVAPAAARLPALHLIVDGRITSGARAWGPRQVFGGLEVFAGRQLTERAIAAMDTQTLQLFAADFGELVEDNFGVLRAALRGLATGVLRVPYRPARALPVVAGASMGLVERLIVLRQQCAFAKGGLQALAMLAHTAEEVRWAPGELVTRAGEPATGAVMVVEGTVRIGASRTAGPGDALGLLETLAGTRHELTGEADTPVRALRTTSNAILDVLEDHPELGLAMISTLSATLLDAAELHVN